MGMMKWTLLTLVTLVLRSAAAVACGGELKEDYGVILTPNYPNHYPPNQECVWKISVSQGSYIDLIFQSFELELCSKCACDGVQVRDGNSVNSPMLRHVCSNYIPTDIVSSSNHLLIKFKSNGSVNKAGFAAYYYKVACGGELKEDYGQIQSPIYQNAYRPNLECVWKISVSQGFHIGLNFQSFQFEYCSNCACDYLEVRDGDSVNSLVLGRFCGNNKPNNIVSSSNHLWIKFKSNGSVNKAGFTANYYKVTCGGELKEDYGVILSPNYPNHYRPNQECVWKISVSQDFLVGLNFQSFELESHSNCDHDYLEVRDGDSVNSPVLQRRFCGNNKPNDIVSSSNHLWIKFKSNGSVNKAGFTVNYFKVMKVNEDNGQIQSLNYPNHYPDNQEYWWKISVSRGSHIRLNFKSFELESHSNCDNDYVEVRDGDSVNSHLLGRFCGNNKPNNIVSSSNHLWIKFKSNGSINKAGFTADYNKVTCGGELKEDYGVILSPNYPNHYRDNQECVWKISVSQGSHIRLTFKSFELESRSNCDYDYLEVRDGDSVNSPVLQRRFCGNNKPNDIMSSSNHLWIKFKSNGSVNKAGFTVNYNKVMKVNVDNGPIQSPNYPNHYPDNQEYWWTISVSQGLHIRLNFKSFELESHSNCDNDYVEVRDGDSVNSPVLGRFCGNNKPNHIVSSSNHLWIKFKSNGSINKAGFTADYYKEISDVTVTCSEPPLIEGSSAQLSCNGPDDPIITSVNWLKDEGDLSSGDHIRFSTGNRIMSISPLNRSDAGEYQCRLGTPFQSKTSEPITIHINYGPDVKIDGPDVVYSGESVSLSCSAVSEPSASFSWTVNGAHKGVTEDKFLISQSDVTHTGEYSCTATNPITERSVTVSHNLLVRELCVNPQLPEQQSKTEGETVFLGFSCSFSRPPRWFVWSSESSEILLSQPHTDPLVPGDADAYHTHFVRVQSQHSVDDVLTSYGDRVSVSSHNLTLVMRNLTLRDSGNYSLIVVFDDWSQLRGETTLLVSHKTAERRSDTASDQA